MGREHRGFSRCLQVEEKVFDLVVGAERRELEKEAATKMDKHRSS